MTDEELKNVKYFLVEYYIYVDIMSKSKQPGDVIVQPEVNNEQNN